MRKAQAARIIGKAILTTLAMGGILVAGAIAPNIFVAIKKILEMKNVAWIDED